MFKHKIRLVFDKVIEVIFGVILSFSPEVCRS